MVYWSMALLSRLNIGHRHVLLTYPVLFILAGALVWLWQEGKPVLPRLVLAGLVLLLGQMLWLWPNYLPFFNLLAGGPSQGYLHLVDSSLDWGQDLPELARWLKQHNKGLGKLPASVAYFGTADLGYWHVEARRLLADPYQDQPAPEIFLPLLPGYYAISATYLAGVYLPLPGPWTPEHERAYQALKQINADHLANADDPHVYAQLQKRYGDQALEGYLRFPGVRLGRLAALLRQRQPDASAGYSILIFKLTAGDLVLALDGPAPLGK
jgi:hypothetical protein